MTGFLAGQPRCLEQDPELFWGFWGKCYNDYSTVQPHDGYAILKRWWDRFPPRTFSGKSDDKEAKCSFVYTSNVDGLFARCGFPVPEIETPSFARGLSNGDRSPPPERPDI